MFRIFGRGGGGQGLEYWGGGGKGGGGIPIVISTSYAHKVLNKSVPSNYIYHLKI